MSLLEKLFIAELNAVSHQLSFHLNEEFTFVAAPPNYKNLLIKKKGLYLLIYAKIFFTFFYLDAILYSIFFFAQAFSTKKSNKKKILRKLF